MSEECNLSLNRFKNSKRAYLECISECLRRDMRTFEILKNLEEKRLASESCVANRTIRNWIGALRSSNREKAEAQLRTEWMCYWNALHPDSQEDDESSNRQVESTITNGPESSAVESPESPDIKEIKQELTDGFLRLAIDPTRSSYLMETAGLTTREPHSILGQATLNGQTYFMVKWKGPHRDELGI